MRLACVALARWFTPSLPLISGCLSFTVDGSDCGIAFGIGAAHFSPQEQHDQAARLKAPGAQILPTAALMGRKLSRQRARILRAARDSVSRAATDMSLGIFRSRADRSRPESHAGALSRISSVGTPGAASVSPVTGGGGARSGRRSSRLLATPSRANSVLRSALAYACASACDHLCHRPQTTLTLRLCSSGQCAALARCRRCLRARSQRASMTWLPRVGLPRNPRCAGSWKCRPVAACCCCGCAVVWTGGG